MELAAPTMEEPPVTGPTSPGGGAHDKGDPGNKVFWSAVATSTDPARARVGTIGDASGNTAQDPPTVAPTSSIAEVRLGRAVRAQ